MKKIIIGFFAILSLAASASLMVNKNTEVNAEGGNANLEVNEIFKGFYNNGVYVKDTQIFVDENKVKNAVLENNDALINHFHGGHITLNRTTYYEEDELYFSYGSGYGTETAEVDGQTVTYLTQFTIKNGVKQGEHTIYNLPGMEEYYCTLDDFVKGAHDSKHVEEPLDLTDWHLEGDVYASTNDDILEAFRLFTAPTWLNKTPSNANFITFAKATVEVVGPTLVMKLWAEGDEGKLFDGVETYGDYHLFSKAIIVKDKEAYQVANGGFEDGLTGWEKVGQIGAVTSDNNYWLNDPESAEGFSFNKDGDNLFSSYAAGTEAAVGHLQSSKFVVGGAGWITFKIGASKNVSLLNVQVVDATTGDILKTFGNTCWSDRTNGTKSGCTLIPYKANISDLLGREVYIRVVDNAKWDYGCLFFDSLNTYYTSTPGDEFNLAEDFGFGGNIYQVFNGDFERGNLDGWVKDGNIGDISYSDSDWFGSFKKENAGESFFSAYAFPDLERHMGYLQSSTFTVGGNGWITFMLGGAGNPEYTNIHVVDADTEEVLKAFGRNEFSDGDLCTLVKHKVDLSEYTGRTVYLRFNDYTPNAYGLFFIDKIHTNYTEVPGNEYHDVLEINLDTLYNGGFETGDLKGWRWIENYRIHGDGNRENLDIFNDKFTFGKVTNLFGYWGSNIEYNKDGEFLFTGLEGNNAESDPNLEFNQGILRSQMFILDENAIVTFKLGGAKNSSTGIRFVNAITGEILASFHNTEFNKHGNEGRLMQYVYEFQNQPKALCYVEIFDFSSGDWGLVAVDSIVVNTNMISGNDIYTAVNDIN